MTGQLLRRYVSVYGAGIDEPILMENAGGTKYSYHFDGIGSVIALTDETGNEAEVYAYSPFGEVNQANSVGNPYLFTGRRFDAETGLYYYQARYYNAALGRFMQVDPIGYADSMNLFVFGEIMLSRFVNMERMRRNMGRSSLTRRKKYLGGSGI